ncbi:MAG: glycosyltransferase [Acidobacteriota bacterium]|nr:glycosyltransferase [Acidobacteriota bacterium]
MSPPIPAAPGGSVPARVALVHDWLTGMRGGERVLEQLTVRFPQAPLYTLFHVPGSVSSSLENRAIHSSFLQQLPGIAAHYRQLLPLFPLAAADLDLEPYDLVVSTSHCVAKAVRVRADAWHVCYCHTPMRYVWDQRDAYFPDRLGLLAGLRHRILDELGRWDAASNEDVDVFVANSTFVRDRIRRHYLRDAEVVPPPIDTDFFDIADPGHDGPSSEYVLSVATLAPYKRIDIAAAACKQLGLELVVPGRAPTRTLARVLEAQGVRFLGFVSPERLRDLYRDALCFLQPGVEDFGMSVVEALACGCPVVALEEGGACDIVVEGEHGLLVNEAESADAFADAIDKVRRIHFNELNLRSRALEFSTPKFHERMDSLFQSLPRPTPGSVAS